MSVEKILNNSLRISIFVRVIKKKNDKGVRNNNPRGHIRLFYSPLPLIRNNDDTNFNSLILGSMSPSLPHSVAVSVGRNPSPLVYQILKILPLDNIFYIAIAKSRFLKFVYVERLASTLKVNFSVVVSYRQVTHSPRMFERTVVYIVPSISKCNYYLFIYFSVRAINLIYRMCLKQSQPLNMSYSFICYKRTYVCFQHMKYLLLIQYLPIGKFILEGRTIYILEREFYILEGENEYKILLLLERVSLLLKGIHKPIYFGTIMFIKEGINPIGIRKMTNSI